MKRSSIVHWFIVIVILSLGAPVFSQTILNSLSELKSKLGESNGNFKMAPGTYYFNTDNCGSGKLFSDAELLFFTGSNSTFDFTGVKFEYDTEIFTLYGNTDILEFWTVGNNNVYLNLTMEDIGNTVPSKGASSIHVDGADNRVEGFKTTTRGSFPYGYGDIFGKGGGAVIRHQKHAGILVRGERNHIKNCTVIMRAYGHGIFMQGSQDALIEGCYVEGELRTVGEVLEEKGTNSPADNVDFLTVWGYYLSELEHDYRFSLQEDGIRCYTTGVNYGDTEDRKTTGTQIKNCTVVKMRSGVTIGWDYSDKVVENCKVLACETGFWFGGNTTASNNSGDASVGPLVSEDVSRSNSTLEVTLLDNYVPKIGNTPYFFFGGSNHKLTIHDGTTSFNDDIVIQVGGKRLAHRWLIGSTEEPWDRTADNCTLINNTKYPVNLKYNVKNSDIKSCGTVSNNGTNNSITQLTDCNYTRTCNNTAENLQAECFDAMSGVQTETIGTNNEIAVSHINSGDWISFSNIDLTHKVALKAIVATDKEGGVIEIREGSKTGTLLGTVAVSNSGSFTTYEESFGILDQITTGAVDLYFVFTGPDGYLFNLDQISFIKDECAEASYNAVLPISAEDFCDTVGVAVESLTAQNQVISSIDDGDYLRYSNVYFGNDDVYNSIRVLASSESGGTIEIRSGGVDGALLSTVEVASTGSFDNYKSFSGYTALNLLGTYDIYLVFKGDAKSMMKVDNFYFVYDQCAGRSYQAFNRIEAEDFCETVGVKIIDDYLGDIQVGDWIRFSNVDFTSTSPLSVKLSLAGYTSGNVNVVIGDPRRGTVLATVPFVATNGWTNWKEFLVSLDTDVTGTHDVYVFFEGGGVNINWLQFTNDFVKGQTNPYERFEAEINDDASGVSSVTTTDIDGNKDISFIESGDYVMFSELDLSEADSIKARVSSTLSGGVIELRVGNKGGEIIGFIDVPNTGSESSWQTVRAKVDFIEGENEIYFVFKGEGNNLLKLNWLQFTKYTLSFDKLQSEDNNATSGFVLTGETSDAEDEGVGRILRFLKPGNWIQFTDVDLTGAKSIAARYGTSYDDGTIDVRLDAADGELIATINMAATGGFSNWETASANLSDISGTHDVFFVFQSSRTVVCNSNWFQFSPSGSGEVFDPKYRIEAEDYSRAFGTTTIATTDVDGEEELGSIQNGDWILFKNIDLTSMKFVDARVASPNTGGRIELRRGAYDGSILSFISVPNTGSASTWKTVNATLFETLAGEYDVYAAFKGSASDLVNINWLQFKSAGVGVEDIKSNTEITSYPNPVGDRLTIVDQANSTLEIYNTNGAKVYVGVISSNTFTLSTKDLKSGLYIFKILNNTSVQTGRFLKK